MGAPPLSAPAGRLRVATANVNGIRAAVRRGFGEWLAASGCDVVALQEVRCTPADVPAELRRDWVWSEDPGELAGRNGVAVLTREPPTAVRNGFGCREFAHEGRHVEVDLTVPGLGALTVASVYVPKGGRPDTEPERHARKLRFLASFGRHVVATRRAARRGNGQLLVLGDLNIAHTPLDLRAWRSNQDSPGFLPEERAWLDAQLSPRTLVDVVRRLHPDEPGPYSWWSWRGRSWSGDAGWRIDYHLATPGLAARATAGGTAREATYEGRMSDHSPVVVDYALDA